jgi:hypothetical protein
MIFVEYESGSKAWRFYDPNVGSVVVSRDVVFDEAGQWAWNMEDVAAHDNTEPFTIEYSTVLGGPDAKAEENEEGTTTQRCPSTPTAPITTVVHVFPPPDYSEDLDVDHDDDAPLQFRTLNSVLPPGSPPGLVDRTVDNELHISSAD